MEAEKEGKIAVLEPKWTVFALPRSNGKTLAAVFAAPDAPRIERVGSEMVPQPIVIARNAPENGVSVDAVIAPGLDPGPTRGASAVERRLLAAGRQA